MLTQKNRFHGYGSLKYVYKNGHVCRARNMIVKTTVNKRRNKTRVAVVVSKKVHKSAVGRNRIRRRVYEIIRSEINDFARPHDLVVIITSSEVRTQPINEVHQTLKKCFLTLGLYNVHPTNGIINPNKGE